MTVGIRWSSCSVKHPRHDQCGNCGGEQTTLALELIENVGMVINTMTYKDEDLICICFQKFESHPIVILT